MSNAKPACDVDATLAPPSDQTVAAEREARLVKVVRDYMAAIEAGQKPNRHDLVAHNPDIATELSACLAGLQFVNSAAAGMDPTSGSAISPIDPADLANGQPLGDFKLVRELGRGGMGVVYEAVQISLNRPVALKVLPLAAALDARHLQRFQNEAQAAAQLHHTNIVPVYFVGCERSVHFYAMQLIQGQTLSQVIAELREKQSHGPATAGLLTLRNEHRQDFFRAIARLGMQAADGLDYAHRSRVVHRDIKPSNLMLDVKGSLWITDFGLAQFYSENNLTQEGDLLGTLRYMSPEQATGKAGVVQDQRTDVYSLGMTLYELLTLERALPGETREQLLSQIGLHDPRPPRSIDKLIPRELEIILAKATAKEPGDRYQTAGAMAEDFRRFLHFEPILARSPSLADKAIKWTRRHRAIAISTLAALLLLAIGLAISTVLVARQAHLTQAALDTAQTERLRATKSEKQARDVVDYLSRVAAEDLADEPQSAPVRKEMLEAALDFYRGFIESGGGDATAAPELAAAQAHVQEILTDLAAVDAYMQTSVRSGLLAEASVAQTLNLTTQQTAMIQQTVIPMLDEVGNRREMRQMTDDQKKKYFGDLAAKIDAATRKIITDPQYRRLVEISRQFRGPAAFSDADVIAALKITADQKEVIRRIQSDHRASLRQMLMQRNASGQRDPQRAAERKLHQAVMAKIMGLLDSDQKLAWKQLVGEPFAGAIRDPVRLGFGPQPGGPDQRGPRRPDDQQNPPHDGPPNGPPDGQGPPQ